MFERYSERARRVIFFARYEASNYGSRSIETEHLLLGIGREDKSLLDRLSISSKGDLREKVDAIVTRNPKLSTSLDLPLTDECKRILAYANEEAERLGHRFIGTEHLVLGILRETGCLAARLLREAGVQLESFHDELAKSVQEPGGSYPKDLPHADRAFIHALVDRLPENALGRAKWVLEQML